MVRFWEVDFVDFGVAAKGAADEGEVSFEETVFGKAFVEFADYVFAGSLFVAGS